MTRFPGVYSRIGTRNWQFALKAPQDLLRHFPGEWAVRCSLGTADLRETNDKAKVLHAEWATRFDALRSGKPVPVDLDAVRRKLLVYAEQKYLPAVDRLSAGYTRAERVKYAHIVALDRQDVLHGIEQGYARGIVKVRAKPLGEPIPVA